MQNSIGKNPDPILFEYFDVIDFPNCSYLQKIILHSEISTILYRDLEERLSTNIFLKKNSYFHENSIVVDINKFEFKNFNSIL